MEKKKIEITESSRRIANKKVARLGEKFKDLSIGVDVIGSVNVINVCSKNKDLENIRTESIMSILTDSIKLHDESYLPTAKEMAEFLGIYQIELQ